MSRKSISCDNWWVITSGFAITAGNIRMTPCDWRKTCCEWRIILYFGAIIAYGTRAVATGAWAWPNHDILWKQQQRQKQTTIVFIVHETLTGASYSPLIGSAKLFTAIRIFANFGDVIGSTSSCLRVKLIIVCTRMQSNVLTLTVAYRERGSRNSNKPLLVRSLLLIARHLDDHALSKDSMTM